MDSWEGEPPQRAKRQPFKSHNSLRRKATNACRAIMVESMRAGLLWWNQSAQNWGIYHSSIASSKALKHQNLKLNWVNQDIT